MDTGRKAGLVYEFGPFRLDASEHQLLRGREVVPLSLKVFETLLVLVENSGHVLGKEELIRAVWPDSFVEDSSLTQNISLLRKALWEGAGEHFIETVPKRGYRFVAPVRRRDLGADDELTEELDIRERSATEVADEGVKEVAEEKTDKPTSEIPEVRRHDSQPQATRLPVRWRLAIACLTLLLVIPAVVYLWKTGAARSSLPMSIDNDRGIGSLAILPLKPLGHEINDEYLGLGMADALIVKLGGFRQLRVIPTSTIFKYTGVEYDALAVGRELGVEAVLDGTVQRAGDRFRVSVMLTRVNDGRTLWSEKFDGQFADIFALQDSISQRVAEALSLRLSGEERRLLVKQQAGNLEAYQSYLMGLYFWNKRTKDGLRRAIEFFRQAVELDPNYAAAFAGLADSYNLTAYHGYDASPSESYSKAKALATKALEIDNTLAEAYATLGMISLIEEKNPRRAEELYRRALELSPNYGTAHVRYSWLSLQLGDLERALQEMKMGQALDPVSPLTNGALGLMFYYRHNYDEAIKFSRKALELEPRSFPAQYTISLSYDQKGMFEEAAGEAEKLSAMAAADSETSDAFEVLGHVYARAGRKDEARKFLARLQKMQRKNPGGLVYLNLVMLYEALGEREAALRMLKEALDAGAVLPMTFRFDPRSEPLRSDTRYQELIRAPHTKDGGPS
jgi:DNA-binding winged helix-turn-helix (wHTH) protein/TolB-like protein/Tfp pilus assembly protein PilF